MFNFELQNMFMILFYNVNNNVYFNAIFNVKINANL
jgi:hypothetical protein